MSLRAALGITVLVAAGGALVAIGRTPAGGHAQPFASGTVADIQRTREFQRADSAVRKRRYATAVALLDRLSAQRGLTRDQLAYLAKQKSIALNGGVPERLAHVEAAPDPVSDYECGPKALQLACGDLGLSVSESSLAKLAGTTQIGTSMAGLAHAARAVGLKANGVQVTRQSLGDIACPAVAWWNRGHFVEVKRVDGDEDSGTALVHDPEDAASKRIAREQLMESSAGYMLELAR